MPTGRLTGSLRREARAGQDDRSLLSLFLKSQRPDAVEVVVRVAAEGDHRLGAGDAGDLGYSFGDYLGEALEVRDADHDDQVVGAGNGVGLRDTLYAQHRLGRLLHPFSRRPYEHDRRYHAGPPLQPERHRSRESVVLQELLVLHRTRLDGDLGGLVQLAWPEASYLHGGRSFGLHLPDGRRLGLAFGPGVEDDLDVHTRLGRLATVLDGDEEDRLIRARQDDVPVRIQGLSSHLDLRDLHAVEGVRVVPGGAGRRRRHREAYLLVVHERLGFFEVALVALLARFDEGVLDGREVVVPDDGIAETVVLDHLGERPRETRGVARGGPRQPLRCPGPDAERANQIVLGVLELRGGLLVGERPHVQIFGSCSYLIQGPLVEPRRVPAGVLQDALEIFVPGVGGLVEQAVRVGDVLANLGRLLGRYAAPGDEEDEREGHDEEQDGAQQRQPGRERPLAALPGAPRSRRPLGTPRGPRAARLRGAPVRSTFYPKPPKRCGRGGTRTPTASRPLDPEPSASTNSATRPRALSRNHLETQVIVPSRQREG